MNIILRDNDNFTNSILLHNLRIWKMIYSTSKQYEIIYPNWINQLSYFFKQAKLFDRVKDNRMFPIAWTRWSGRQLATPKSEATGSLVNNLLYFHLITCYLLDSAMPWFFVQLQKRFSTALRCGSFSEKSLKKSPCAVMIKTIITFRNQIFL